MFLRFYTNYSLWSIVRTILGLKAWFKSRLVRHGTLYPILLEKCLENGLDKRLKNAKFRHGSTIVFHSTKTCLCLGCLDIQQFKWWSSTLETKVHHMMLLIHWLTWYHYLWNQEWNFRTCSLVWDSLIFHSVYCCISSHQYLEKNHDHSRETRVRLTQVALLRLRTIMNREP